MNHQSYYSENSEYARFLAGQAEGFFGKYVNYLSRCPAGGKILDAGCGTGQVVARLESLGFNPIGIEVSHPNVQAAAGITSRCQLYDGRVIPFENDSFDAVGSFNVLEHVEDPEGYIVELVRVLKPGGQIVLSSPNFLRVLGWKDYHPHMRGIGNKWRNAQTLWKKWRAGRLPDAHLKFERMSPVERHTFQPDDDAIIATNPLEMAWHLRKAGCRIHTIHCSDRIIPPWIDWPLNATPLKFVMFNAFLAGIKIGRAG